MGTSRSHKGRKLASDSLHESADPANPYEFHRAFEIHIDRCESPSERRIFLWPRAFWDRASRCRGKYRSAAESSSLSRSLRRRPPSSDKRLRVVLCKRLSPDGGGSQQR